MIFFLFFLSFLKIFFNTCSDKGVLKTLSVPYFSFNPMEHLKTPPNLTSSPKTTHLNNKKNHRKLNIYIYILMPFKYYFEIYFGSFSKAISKA
jgi:hypothetical protein